MDKKPKVIKYTELPADLKASADFVLRDEGEYDNLIFSGNDFSGKTHYHLRFENIYFKGVNFSQAKIIDVKFSNIKFEDCDLANLKLEKAFVEKTEFIKCRMTGFKIIEGNIRDVLFKNSQLKLSQFRLSKFKNSAFEHSLLEEADFYGAELFKVVFCDSDLTKAEMSAAKLKETDFRTSKIAGLNIGIEGLKGAVIDPSQISDLAWLLGAKIEWKD